MERGSRDGETKSKRLWQRNIPHTISSVRKID